MIDKLLLSLDGMRTVLAFTIICALGDAFLLIVQAFLLTSALTNIWYAEPLTHQIPYLAGFAACFIARQLGANIRSKRLDAYSATLAERYRSQLLEKAFKEGSPLIQKEGTGGFTTLLLEGVDQVESYIRLVVPKMAFLFIVPPLLLIALFVADWISGLIALIVFPAIILEMVLIGHTAKQEAGKQHREYQRLSNHFIDSLRGIDTLNFFGQNKHQSSRIFASSEAFRKATIRTLRVATLSGAVLDAFSTISVAAIAVMLGFRLVDGSIVLFPSLFVLILAPDYFRPIRDFASDYHASLEGKNALAQVLALLDRTERPEDLQPALPPLQSLALNDVSYSYGNHQVLTHCSFDAYRGQRIGIVGPSGSGKSTLATLLAGFADPTTGSVTLNGQTLTTLQTPSWKQQVVYLPQNPYLFHATLRENLTFYQPTASDEELAHVIEAMALQPLIDELPNGLDTLIGEGERALSGGQAQRIALARTMLKRDCTVLIFDEPTAHLDIETEYELKEKMLPLMEDKLVFFATHRLHWLLDMDYVIALDNHTIAHQGNTTTMVETCSTTFPLSAQGAEA